MGFFSLRRDEDLTAVASDSVVQVIRSRFLSRNKGKDREPPISYVAPATTAETLAGTPATINTSATTRRRHSKVLPALPAKPPDIPRRATAEITAPRSRTNAPAIPPPPAPLAPKNTPTTTKITRKPPSEPTATQTPTDSVTVTLAQRLNELAQANSDGLLSDDEYRMLRQNVFERFAGGASVPVESPHVPQSRGASTAAGTTPRPLSNFVVNPEVTTRSPSLRSRSSMSSILKRATSSRRSSSAREADSSSVVSSISSRPFRFLRRKTSASSFTTNDDDTMSVSQASISSRRTAQSQFQPHASRSTNNIRRHAAATTPPSSYPGLRSVASSSAIMNAAAMRDVFDEANLATVSEINAAIAAVEAEGRRLIDAFNGLELTTMAKRQRGRSRGFSDVSSAYSGSDAGDHRASMTVEDFAPLHRLGIGSNTTLNAASRARRAPSDVDSDMLSIRSGTSAVTAPSVKSRLRPSPLATGSSAMSIRSVRSVRSGRVGLPLTPSRTTATIHATPPRGLSRQIQTGGLNRQSSITNMSRRAYPMGGGGGGGGSVGLGTLQNASTSVVSLARSTVPMTSVPEDGPQVESSSAASAVSSTRSVAGSTDGSSCGVRVDDIDGGMREEFDYEMEMEDIRRRREEVAARYEARLEYLRAKLHGAAIHEKLLKR